MNLNNEFIKYLNSVLLGQFAGNLSEMSRATGIHRNQFDRYLSGANSPTLKTVQELADSLKVSPFELLGLESLSNAKRSPIEDRLAALEARVFSRASNPEPEESPPDLEALKDELDLEAYGPPPKKNGRKTGSE